MELLGPSIETLFRKTGKDVMDLRSVCSLGMQLVSRPCIARRLEADVFSASVDFAARNHARTGRSSS